MKVYKVVCKEDRVSSVIHCEKFKLKYPKGAIVKAPPKTMGIFCFKTLKDAQDFAFDYEIIIEVEGIGEPYEPDFAVDIRYLKYFTKYRELGNCYKERVPKGTICFKKVKVLT